MKMTFATLAATAIVAVSAVSAQAVTVNSSGINAIEAPQSYDFGDVLTAGGSLSYNLKAFEDLTVNGFIIGGTDSAVGNLVNVLFGIGSATTGYSNIFTGTFGEFAEAGIVGGPYTNGTEFSIEFTSSASADVSVTGNFETVEGLNATPIPVPAAGLLLGGVMAAGAFAARRKAKKAA